MVEVTKTAAGPVEVVAIRDDTKETLPILATDEAAFVALLTPEQMGTVGLEEILQTFVKSLRVIDQDTMALGVVKVDKEAEAREMAKWKQEAIKVQQKKEEDEDRIRQEKARKRARREKDRLENQALAREHLLQRVAYARKIMQIEVERMEKLKQARAKAQKEIEMSKPELVLPAGLLLKVRRVINGEMATLEIKKNEANVNKEDGDGSGSVEFKTTGDSGEVHTLLTSERELVDLLDEKHIREQTTTSDLLRIFSKMIVFEQTETSPTNDQANTSFGLRLHAVDEVAEAERIRQWRDQASRIVNTTNSFATSEASRPSTAMSEQHSADVANLAHAPAPSDRNGKSILLVESLIAGERMPDGMEVEMSFGEGSRRKAYIVTLRLSGHKLSFTARLKSSRGSKPLLYSCSLDHALMLLPTEKQLWDTERGLFNSLRRCIQIIDGGRSLVLRRNARGSLARDRGHSVAQKIAEEAGLPSPDENENATVRKKHNSYRDSKNGGSKWGGFGSRRQAHEEENQELMRLIEEQYFHASFEADEEFGLDWIEGEQKRNRRRKRGRRGRSMKKINGSTPEDIARRLAAIEGTHKELLPASRGPSRGASRGGPGGGGLDSAIVRDISERPRVDKLKIFGGFGKCSSRDVFRNKFPSLDGVQSSILSVQGSIAARERLHGRLCQSYVGPGVDPLIPLEARPRGKLFVKRILRDLLNGDTQTVSGFLPADLPPGMSSHRHVMPESLQAVESKLLIGGGSAAFQIVAQRNSWGSPERRRGPGYRTLACKWERKKKTEKAKRVALKRTVQRRQHQLQHERGLE